MDNDKKKKRNNVYKTEYKVGIIFKSQQTAQRTKNQY